MLIVDDSPIDREVVEFLRDVEDIQVRGDLAWLVSGYGYTSDSGDGKSCRDARRRVSAAVAGALMAMG